MKSILLGTTNPAKVKRFSQMLKDYDVTFYTLDDLNIKIEPQETGLTPEENAVIKAKFYGTYYDAVICNDSGLYFDELELRDSRQPGLKIRTPFGKRLNDNEMIDYYSKLIHSLGGKVLSYYLDGIAVYHKGLISSFMEQSEAILASAFYMIDKPSSKMNEGWPLDSLSINKETGHYFVDRKYDDKQEHIALIDYRKRLINFLVKALDLKKSST